MSILLIKQNLYTYIQQCPIIVLAQIDSALAPFQKGYFFSWKYKVRRWDGRVHMMNRQYKSVPTGLIDRIARIIYKEGLDFEVDDRRTFPGGQRTLLKDLKLKGVELRTYQKVAIKRCLVKERGILDLATNAGKTEIAIGLMKVLNLKTLILTHRKELLYQTSERIKQRIGWKVDRVGDGLDESGNEAMVAMVQTLSKLDAAELKKRLKDFQLLICDETHHSGSARKTYYKVGMRCPAFFRFGLCVTSCTKVLLSNMHERTLASLFYEREGIATVMSYNFQQKILQPTKAKVIRRPYRDRITVAVIQKPSGERFRLRATPDHKIYVVGVGRYVKMRDLKPGMKVMGIELSQNYCRICGKEIPTHKIVCGKKCRIKNWSKVGAQGAKKRFSQMSKEERRRAVKWEVGYEKMKAIVKSSKFKEGQAQRVRDWWKDESNIELQEQHRERSRLEMKRRNEEGLASIASRIRWKKFKTKEERRKEVEPMIEGGKEFRFDGSNPPKSWGPRSWYSKGAIAKDGHQVASSLEERVDNWLFENGLEHKVHPYICSINKFADFLVGGLFIEVDGMRRDEDCEKWCLYRKHKIPHIILTDFSLAAIQEKLGFLLAKDPVCCIISAITERFNGRWVYDLRVSENHNFFANGILVHNSGTPYTKDEVKDLRMVGMLGPTIMKVSNVDLVEEGFSAKPEITMAEIDQSRLAGLNYSDAYLRGIVHNQERNEKIYRTASKLDLPTLIIIQHIEHGRNLKKLFKGHHCDFIWGDQDFEIRDKAIANFRRGKIKYLISSVILDEGIDLPCIKHLIMGAGGKSPIRTVQRLGRALRIDEGKDKVYISDFLDVGNQYLQAHARRRKRDYEKEGFSVAVV